MMKNYRFTFSFLLGLTVAVFAAGKASAQGCVAVRNMASPCGIAFDSLDHHTRWQFSLNYRYFKSFRHFSGDHEETHRVEEGTQVINHDNSVIFGATYNFSRRWSFSAIVPFVHIDRSSMYEHMGNRSGERYHTQSKGLGDVRVSAYYAVIPESIRGNFTVGLGMKLPTGDYNYMDYFHKSDGLRLLPVDQSIQPGDGGWGITTEVNITRQLSPKLYGYFSGFYLFNPRNTNGTLRGPNLVDGIPLSNEMSVTDQFLFRMGARYAIHHLQVGAGIRYEGIPVEDLLGDSDGFRRPGYIISAEPSVLYTIHRKHAIGVNFPIALYRNRTQSVLDKQRTEITGTYRHGDAAFADWLLSVFYVFSL